MRKDKSKRFPIPFSENSPTLPPEKENSVSESIFTACERLSSERYQAFVENIEEGIYELDIHGNFLYFNDSLCKIFGYPREEIQFQNFAKFMDEEQAKRGFDAFSTMYQTGQGVSDLIWKIIRKDEKLSIIELSANLITNKKGEKIGFRGIARDITDKFNAQRALKKSERRYRTLLDFVPFPLVVFTLDGRVSYLNQAFTEKFGWTLAELEGKTIPYVPPGLERETKENIKKLFEDKIIMRQETQRLTKDGQVLDVSFRAAVYSETEEIPSGELVILRDITHEKRIARNNEALLRISMALPKYPDLEGLLDYVSDEIKRIMQAEGALVILLDEEKNELFFKSAAHDDSATERRMKEVRFPADKGVSGKVIRTGKPYIVMDTSKDPDFYSVVDTQVGFRTLNLLDVPLKTKDRIIGVLCAMNKKKGKFDRTDVELLNMIAGTVALSIENAKFSEQLKETYNEVASLNRAKDKVINHLSHELRTPLSILGASLNILSKRLSSVPRDTWEPTVERAQRNLDRILEMQYEVEDIMRDKHYETHHLVSWLLDECADELESLFAEELGEGRVVEKIRSRIDEIFGETESPPQDIFLDQFVRGILDEIRPLYSHRKVELLTQFEITPAIKIPIDPLRKVVVGLIKNALENTPDEGKIEVVVQNRGKGAELVVHDYGVGITADNQRRIFEGFFATQDTMDYSSRRPYDFNAGGKGADLLRMKIFSERYNFKIHMTSSRCRHIPGEKDICPGRISNCDYCKEKEDCCGSGGTVFSVYFPPASEGNSLTGNTD
ncbi:MAG: PAS domain S-box protein [Desulfobacteraceae bacterium]|nr:MAG: PAS domain S-box protein [Desulfobacteraceae bacterium]